MCLRVACFCSSLQAFCERTVNGDVCSDSDFKFELRHEEPSHDLVSEKSFSDPAHQCWMWLWLCRIRRREQRAPCPKLVIGCGSKLSWQVECGAFNGKPKRMRVALNKYVMVVLVEVIKNRCPIFSPHDRYICGARQTETMQTCVTAIWPGPSGVCTARDGEVRFIGVSTKLMAPAEGDNSSESNLPHKKSVDFPKTFSVLALITLHQLRESSWIPFMSITRMLRDA